MQSFELKRSPRIDRCRKYSRKQQHPRKRIRVNRHLVFECEEGCICWTCRPSNVELVGDVVGLIFEFLEVWPLKLDFQMYCKLLGVKIDCSNTSLWWHSGMVNSATCVMQRGVYNRYQLGLHKHNENALAGALKCATLSHFPYRMLEDGMWDDIPPMKREITVDNQHRINNMHFLKVSSKDCYTHFVDLELQVEKVYDDEGVGHLLQMAWRFSVYPKWKFLRHRRPNPARFCPDFSSPINSALCVFGNRLGRFDDTNEEIKLDLDAFDVDVQTCVGQMVGTWLPWGSRVCFENYCRSRHIKQYFYVGIETSEDPQSTYSVKSNLSQTSPFANDMKIPLFEIMTHLGDDGEFKMTTTTEDKPVLNIKHYSLGIGITSRAELKYGLCGMDEDILVYQAADIVYI